MKAVVGWKTLDSGLFLSLCLQRCEELKGLKGQVSQEQELRAVVESCLMEQDVAWSNAQAQLQEVQAITRNAGVLLEQMR